MEPMWLATESMLGKDMVKLRKLFCRVKGCNMLLSVCIRALARQILGVRK